MKMLSIIWIAVGTIALQAAEMEQEFINLPAIVCGSSGADMSKRAPSGPGALEDPQPRTSYEEAFVRPDFHARPWVYWYWMNGNVTRAGITKDLEEMASAGIGGAYLMPIGGSGKNTHVNPPVNPLSEAWWNLVRYAVAEAKRLGMRIAMNACDGWALAGGPWITPELSMQKLVHSELMVEGGRPFAGKVPQPPVVANYYRDLAVYALPVKKADLTTSTQLKPKVTTNMRGVDPAALVEGTKARVGINHGWIQYEFSEPFTARSIYLDPGPRSLALCRMEIQVSDDGIAFRSHESLQPPWHGWFEGYAPIRYSLKPVTARFFRFVLNPLDGVPFDENIEGSKYQKHGPRFARHIELSSAPAISVFSGKAAGHWRRAEWTDEEHVPREVCVQKADIIDLTGKIKQDGTLEWTPPEGFWKIQRFGYTSTGARNEPSGTGGGLEADKLSAKAARAQFEGWFGEAVRRVGPELAGKTLWMNHTDSWECGCQNWSPAFREEFQKRRGYDPLPWLPVMIGSPVESAEHSERFLYDIRRTISDLIVEEFYGTFVGLTHDAGARFSMESIAPVTTADSMELFRLADYPMGEFWFGFRDYDKPNDILDAISGGHIYGKRIIPAEAFTQISMNLDEHPCLIEPMGAHNLAQGINRLVLHVWAHQAFPERSGPGVSLDRIGVFFSGTQPWHVKGRAWFDSLIRSQSMLQQGAPVVDICFFNGEEIPSRAFLPESLPVAVPHGYKYDTINRDALLRYATAREGSLQLETGMRYRVLVLGSGKRMSSEVASKIGELAEAGVPVVGIRPEGTWSLAGYPASDKKLRRIVASSWGKVRPSTAFQEVLKEIALGPDLSIGNVDMTPVFRPEEKYYSAPFSWNHRRLGDTDAYFISNQERKIQDERFIFRVAGRVPEIWDPNTGTMQVAGIWSSGAENTDVHLRLSPAQSVFVVFRNSVSGEDQITQVVASNSGATVTNDGSQASLLAPQWVEGTNLWVSRNGEWLVTRRSGGVLRHAMDNLPGAEQIAGPWHVSFSPRRGTPDFIELKELGSLTEHGDPAIRHYAGTAIYTTGFMFTPRAGLSAGDIRYYLDLGAVHNLVGITLNGKDLGVMWRPPFIVEITSALRSGKNELKIEVANTWRNRIIGDLKLPAEERISWSVQNMCVWFNARTPLVPSGLAGPVRILAVRKAVSDI